MTDSETRRLRFDGLFAAYAPDTAVTVGGDGIVRKIAVTWGTWSYTVTYDGLGSTPPLVAPANARSLEELRRQGRTR
jgi:hypothetical protein